MLFISVTLFFISLLKFIKTAIPIHDQNLLFYRIYFFRYRFSSVMPFWYIAKESSSEDFLTV